MLTRLSISQVVCDLLLHGPIKILGKRYSTLTEYYFEVSKRIQKGHWCNVPLKSVTNAIRSPTLMINGYVLNNPSAIVCDCVHWALSDYATKVRAHRAKEQCQVRVHCLHCILASQA
jgi:hypothetical protein